jgi:hypothetical protein
MAYTRKAAVPSMYRLAVKNGAVTMKGTLLDREGNALAEYSLELPFLGTTNANYQACQKDMKDVIDSLVPEDRRDSVAAFTVSASLLPQILAHTGARANLPITADTLALSDVALIGDLE